MKSTQIVPAYGREYRNKAEVIADLEAEKDFTILDVFCTWDGMQCNRSDLLNAGYTEVKIRYGKGLAKVMVHKL